MVSYEISRVSDQQIPPNSLRCIVLELSWCMSVCRKIGQRELLIAHMRELGVF